MATKKQFEKKMGKLTTCEIVGLIDATWDDVVGGLFREVGFDIIWDRCGEDVSDAVYDTMWYMHN